MALGAGILLYFQLPIEPPFWLGAAATLAACLLLFATRGSAVAVMATICVLAAVAGFTGSQIRTWSVAAPVLERRITAVLGGVVESVRQTPRGLRAILRVERLGRLPPHALPARARVLLLKRGPIPEPGDRIRLFGRFQPPAPPVSPHAYDFQRALFFRGIGAVGFALAPATIDRPPARTWTNRLESLRNELSARVRGRLQGDTGAVAAALLVGDRDWISDEAEAAMRDAGIAHLLAISGLHMGLVAGCVFSFVRLLLSLVPRTALSWPTRGLAAAAAMLFATMYLFLSGAAVPTLRAFVMTMIVLLGVMIGRRAISMRLIAAAALAILILRPEFLLTASFQLSFAAVTCLVAVYETGYWNDARRSDGNMRRFLRYVALLGLSSLVATLATLPVALYHFQKAALYGIASNMFAVPAAGIWIMPWGVTALVLMPFGLEGLALVPMGWGIDLVLGLARYVANWPHATHMVSAGPGWVLGLAAFGGLWLCLWRRVWRFFGLVPLAVALVLLVGAPWRPPTILIKDRGAMIGVYSDGRLETTSGRPGFETRVWRRRAGIPEDGTGRARARGFTCDPLGCVFDAPDIGTVAWSRTAQSLSEDCLHADFIVTRIRVPDACLTPRLILGPPELRPGGAIAIWVEGTNQKTVYSRHLRGVRPWTGPTHDQARKKIEFSRKTEHNF